MADFDGDGRRDLITGCFEGGAYLLSGVEGGAFAAPRAVLDVEGDVLRLGQYWDDEKKWTGMDKSPYRDQLGISAFPFDLDGDGDLDLVIGSNEGGIYLWTNTGTPREPRWAARAAALTTPSGEALKVPSGHAMPVVADWDGDGRRDLVSGSDDGDVVWFRNVGSGTEPTFERAVLLVPKTGEGPGELGERTQVAVCDFDADGDLDLLLGDYHHVPAKEGEKSTCHGWVWLVRRAGSAQ